MKSLWALFFVIPAFAANVPNRYIVELSTEPVAVHVRAQGRSGLRSAAATQHRTRLRAEQASARARIAQAEGTITGSVENVKNALLVTIDDAKAARLASVAGVRKVYPVRYLHLMLDHALPLHHVPDAWTQVGIANAGAGVKIAFIDSGIDNTHAAFQDAGFAAPAGFPIGDSNYTNNKVIVARSYVNMLPNPDPDPSPADHVGHGTATAMAAAGEQAAGPLATISGVAPAAFVGSYKVFGTPGSNDMTTEDAVLAAIDDAVADGMDVINLSLGSDIALRMADDPETQAVENAAALGVIVVCSAGNNGSDPMTVGTPAAAPSVIAVGATGNDRIFSARATTPDGKQLQAAPGSASIGATSAVSGPVSDVAALGPDALGCSAFPANSLAGAIALISRGTCTFESKINNAASAGAIGALIYDNVDEAPITMAMASATLPAQMISKADGLALQQAVRQQAVTITLDFALGPVYADPQHLMSFSAAGPNIDLGIKPDLVAVGGNLYTAAQRLDGQGVIYSATGFAVENGTSFSAPIVAGAAALLKSARPGLAAAQYRSLLVNSAAPSYTSPGTQARVQQAGAGMLDMLAALNATAAAAPVSLSFGTGGGTVQQNLTVWNLGTTADTFQIGVAALDGSTVPSLPFTSVQLDPGASVQIPITFAADGLAAGTYDGFIQIQGTQSSVTTRVPYWHGVSSGNPARITTLKVSSGGRRGAVVQDAVLFRVTDENGLPLMDSQPQVTSVSGGGSVDLVGRVGNAPYSFDVYVRLGARPGANVFRIQVGDLTRDVTIIGQ